MEELIYWGIIFLFYLFSAYRSRQKKVETEDIQVPDIPIQPEPQKPKADFNIFEFLDDAMEKSALELDDTVEMNLVQSPTKDSSQSETNTRQITPDYDLNSITSSVDNESFDIRDKHLSHLKSRIETKTISSNSEQKLLTLQQKLKNKPTKLAIVMQAIFEPPKSQGI